MSNVDVNEKFANLGYLALIKQTDKDTAETPDTFVPLYSEDITHNVHLDEDSPVVGIREARFKVFRGQEEIGGTISVLAEPTTIGHFFNMLLYKEAAEGTGTSTTGYTHEFSLGGSPKAYTLEFLKGNVPVRLYGVEASSITPTFDENKMVLEIKISARGQFSTAKLTSASGTTIVLDDDERLSPADGLVAGDTLMLYDVGEGTDEEAVISEIDADGKTITVIETISGTYTAGDITYLKGLTPSYTTIGEPFNWALTEFKFGADATTALAATQTRLEPDSKWTLRFDMRDEAGERRSGGYSPSNFVRTTGDVDIVLKKFFDDGQELDRFLQLDKYALVIEHTSPTDAGTDGTKGLVRLTIDEYYIRNYGIPLKSGEIIYADIELAPVYNADNSRMFKFELITSEETI